MCSISAIILQIYQLITTLLVMIMWCFLPNWILCKSKRKMINSSISKPMRGTQLTYTHLWFLDLTQTWIFFYFFCWSLIFLFCHKFYLAKYFHLQIWYIFFSHLLWDLFFCFSSYLNVSLEFTAWSIIMCL